MFNYIPSVSWKVLRFNFCVFSSYGSVFKAIHKESGQVVAIKQVPVESDLQEIIKEISIMQQCDRFEDNTAFSKLQFSLHKLDQKHFGLFKVSYLLL